MLQKVSKLEAGKEQLLMAIELYFSEAHLAPVHTLACAAYEIFDGICAHRNLERGILHRGAEFIKPELQKEFWKQIHKPKNFFKHSDKDPDPEDVVEIGQELSSHYIRDAISLYQRIVGNDIPCEMMSFVFWYRVNNPELWDSDFADFDQKLEEVRESLINLDKQAAYQQLLQACKMIK